MAIKNIKRLKRAKKSRSKIELSRFETEKKWYASPFPSR